MSTDLMISLRRSGRGSHHSRSCHLVSYLSYGNVDASTRPSGGSKEQAPPGKLLG